MAVEMKPLTFMVLAIYVVRKDSSEIKSGEDDFSELDSSEED